MSMPSSSDMSKCSPLLVILHLWFSGRNTKPYFLSFIKYLFIIHQSHTKYRMFGATDIPKLTWHDVFHVKFYIPTVGLKSDQNYMFWNRIWHKLLALHIPCMAWFAVGLNSDSILTWPLCFIVDITSLQLRLSHVTSRKCSHKNISLPTYMGCLFSAHANNHLRCTCNVFQAQSSTILSEYFWSCIACIYVWPSLDIRKNTLTLNSWEHIQLIKGKIN